MAEYNFELEMSDYYKTRSKLLKSHGIPKLSDAKKNLGNSVAKVLFEQCEKALREDFGLKEPLKGPGDTLWISPSDLLRGKVALKPPFTPKCLQALTHKGILNIGQDLEDKFRREMELDKQKALDKYKSELLASVEDRIKSEIKDVEIRERMLCQLEMEKLQKEFEVNLKTELDNLEMRIREQYEDIIRNHESSLKMKWEEKLKDEVQKTVSHMTTEYLAKLDEQEKKLSDIFELELRKQEILKDFDTKLCKRKAKESLRQLKHNLECTNLVNMMYILCTERQKCCDQKQEIENHYKSEIAKLKEEIKEKDVNLKKVTDEKLKEIKEVALREQCLVEVLRQFQKFINFALRAAPTQAEFLLSVEKMMVFELTNEVATTDIPKPKEAAQMVSWIYGSKSKVSSSTVSSIEVHDHHNCFRELNPAPKEILDQNDVLPFMYFKNQTYVREDFRDMLSGGVKISSSNELWNKDVEILVENWRQINEQPADDEDKDVRNQKNDSVSLHLDDYDYLTHSERHRSKQSTVQFWESDLSPDKDTTVSADSRKLSRKSSLKPSSFPIIVDAEAAPSEDLNLLATRDSLELLLEKKQKSLVSFTATDAPEELSSSQRVPELTATDETDLGKEFVVKTKDSIIKRMSEMAKSQSSGEFMASPNDSIEILKYNLEEKTCEIKPVSSKISTARDSVEILRESLHKLRTPSQICQRKYSKRDSKSNKGLSAMGFSDTCCDRCKRKEQELASVTSDYAREGSYAKTESLAGDERSVKISRIQIINLDDYTSTPSVVSFDSKPVFMNGTFSNKHKKSTGRSKTASVRSSGRKITKKQLKKGQETIPDFCDVIGDRESKEGDQSNDEFVAQRIHSLVKMISDKPHLIQLFTSGIRLLGHLMVMMLYAMSSSKVKETCAQ